MYLDNRNTKGHGFQPTAIVHSLPKALFLWALLLSAIQGLWAIFAGPSPHLPLYALLPIAGICVYIWRALHPRQKPFVDLAPVPTLTPPTFPIPVEDQKGHDTAELMV